MANFQTYTFTNSFQLVCHLLHILKHMHSMNNIVKLKLKLLYWHFQKYKIGQYSVKVSHFSQA